MTDKTPFLMALVFTVLVWTIVIRAIYNFIMNYWGVFLTGIIIFVLFIGYIAITSNPGRAITSKPGPRPDLTTYTGRGRTIQSDGTELEGEFKDNVLVKGIKTLSSGQKQEGKFNEKGLVKGTVTFPDGRRQEWKNGKIIFDDIFTRSNMNPKNCEYLE